MSATTHQRPLPTVVGPTENALRALLMRLLVTTPLDSYGEPDRIRQAAAGEPLDQRLGAAGTVGADQDLATGTLSGPLAG